MAKILMTALLLTSITVSAQTNISQSSMVNNDTSKIEGRSPIISNNLGFSKIYCYAETTGEKIDGMVRGDVKSTADIPPSNRKVKAEKVENKTSKENGFINEKKHSFPADAEVEKYGFRYRLIILPSNADDKTQIQNLEKINSKLLKTVEELTLQLIQKDKQLTEQQKRQQK